MESRMATEDPKSVLNYREYELDTSGNKIPDGNGWFRRTAKNGRYWATKIEAKSFDPDDAGSPFGKLNDRETELNNQVAITEKAQSLVFKQESDMKKEDELQKFYEEQNSILGGLTWHKDIQDAIIWFEKDRSQKAWLKDQSNAIIKQEGFIENLRVDKKQISSKYKDTLINLQKDKEFYQKGTWSGWDKVNINNQLTRIANEEKDIRRLIMDEEIKIIDRIAIAEQKLIEMENSQTTAKEEYNSLWEIIANLQKQLKNEQSKDIPQRVKFLKDELAKNKSIGFTLKKLESFKKEEIIRLSDINGFNNGHISHPGTIDGLIESNNDKIIKCINRRAKQQAQKSKLEWEFKWEKSKEDLIRVRYEKSLNKHYGWKDKAMIEAVRWDLYATEIELASMKARQEWLRVLLSEDHASWIIVDRIGQLKWNSRYDTVWWTLGSIVTWAAEWIWKLFGSWSWIRSAFNKGKNWTP